MKLSDTNENIIDIINNIYGVELDDFELHYILMLYYMDHFEKFGFVEIDGGGSILSITDIGNDICNILIEYDYDLNIYLMVHIMKTSNEFSYIGKYTKGIAGAIIRAHDIGLENFINEVIDSVASLSDDDVEEANVMYMEYLKDSGLSDEEIEKKMKKK